MHYSVSFYLIHLPPERKKDTVFPVEARKPIREGESRKKKIYLDYPRSSYIGFYCQLR